MKPPCIKNGVDCPRRRPGCQTNCEELKPLHEQSRLRREAAERADIYNSYVIPIVIKNRRK
jgi:hypothetical protein